MSTSGTNNPAVSVSLLFEHDDCRVYRFWDAGHPRYFVKCAGAASAGTLSTVTRSCGKNCSRTDVEDVPNSMSHCKDKHDCSGNSNQDCKDHQELSR